MTFCLQVPVAGHSMAQNCNEFAKYEGRSINKFQTAPFHQFLK